MKQLLSFFLASLALLSAPVAHAKHFKPYPKPAPAFTITLSEQDKLHLLRDAFTVVKTVWEVPEPVHKQLLGKSKDLLDGMADFGQPFQTTDMVGPKPLPFRRLVFAATSQGYCLVYYEYGGYGYGQEIELVRLFGGQVVRAWAGSLTETRRLLNLPEVRTEISKGRYSDKHQGE